jgi:SAM-dependent methyltransferase
VQFLICTHGNIVVECTDGQTSTEFTLDRPEVGLLIPAGIWATQTYKASGSVLTVLCDQPYEPDDYIRDFESYKTFRRPKHIASGEKMTEKNLIRLNLGCGGRPLPGYINVDMDTLDEIRARYPNQTFDSSLVVEQYDLFNLPYADNSVDEIRSEGLIEHLPFIDEPRFFYEVRRILKPGGTLYLSTVDFEMVAKQWLAAEDDWKDFYRDDEEAIMSQHWFGTYTYEAKNRWGYLAATLFGSQNGAGQFHTNCYSEAKLRAVCKKLGLAVVSIDHFRWKGDRDHMLGLTATKPAPVAETSQS